MLNKVKNYVEKYHMLNTGDTVVTGVSGGADSVCLLFVLLELQREIPFAIRVVHVHHGIRTDADLDAEYVEQLCKEYHVPYKLVRADIPRLAAEQGLSEEEAGRMVRYEAFRKELESTCHNKQGRIAVAHNSNDRAETMLFHLFRGTGLTGLASIRPVNGEIIRPLLCVERKEIETFLNERGIRYCNDSTNAEDQYARNRIRHRILPFAQEQITEGAISHMTAAADNVMEAEEYLVLQTKQAYERVVINQIKGIADSDQHGKMKSITIDISKLLTEHPYIRGRIILLCMEQLTKGRKDITSTHIHTILELIQKEGNKQVSLPYQLIARREYGHLEIEHQELVVKCNADPQSEYPDILISIPGEVAIPGLGNAIFTVFDREKTQLIPEKTYTKWFDYDKITANLMFRVRRPGDYLMINRDFATKSIQDYMVNEKIPKADRSSCYLLTEGSHVLWVPGHRISENYKVEDSTEKILQVQIEKGVIQNG